MSPDAETIQYLATNVIPIIMFKYMFIPMFLVGLMTRNFRKNI